MDSTAEERIAELEAELATSQQQMMMAAQFGQNLLSENESLKQQLLEVPSSLHDNESSGLAEQQVIEAQAANDALLVELTEKDTQLEAVQRQLKVAQKSAEEIVELQEINVEVKEQLQRNVDEKISLKEKLVQANKQLKSMSNELSLNSAQVEELQTRLEENRAAAAARKSPRKQTEDAIEELEKLRVENKELTLAKTQMETGVFALSKENQRMQRDIEEQNAFLAQAKETIKKLGEEQNSSNDGAGSLLAELENEMNEHTQKQEEIMQAREKEAESDAPENCMEYFLTLQTALKIALTLKYPHKADLVYSIRGVDLYYKMVNSSVPFHAWYPWTRKYLHQMAFGKDVKPAALSKSPPPQQQSKWSSLFGFAKK